MRNPADWSPWRPFLYAGVYFVTGGVNPDLGLAAVALLGGLMVLLVYLLGRRLAACGGPAGAAAGRDLSGLHRQQRADPERADRRLHAVGRGARVPVGGRSRALGLGVAPPGRDARRDRAGAARVPAVRAVPRADRPGSLSTPAPWRVGVLAAALSWPRSVLVLPPGPLRNYLVLDRFVPVTTGGGKALFVATYLPGTGAS